MLVAICYPMRLIVMRQSHSQKSRATAELRIVDSPEVRALERGDANRLWDPTHGINPFFLAPPDGLFQRNDESGHRRNGPQYMKNLEGTTVNLQSRLSSGLRFLTVRCSQVCDKWEVVGYLSEGGFGRGWKCLDQSTGLHVFMKTFRTAKDREPTADSDYEGRHESGLQREISALLHPRVSNRR